MGMKVRHNGMEIELTKSEERTYTIIQAAISQCPSHKRLEKVEDILYGQNGKESIINKLNITAERVNHNQKILYAAIGVVGTLSISFIGGVLVWVITVL